MTELFWFDPLLIFVGIFLLAKSDPSSEISPHGGAPVGDPEEDPWKKLRYLVYAVIALTAGVAVLAWLGSPPPEDPDALTPVVNELTSRVVVPPEVFGWVTPEMVAPAVENFFENPGRWSYLNPADLARLQGVLDEGVDQALLQGVMFTDRQYLFILDRLGLPAERLLELKLAFLTRLNDPLTMLEARAILEDNIHGVDPSGWDAVVLNFLRIYPVYECKQVALGLP